MFACAEAGGRLVDSESICTARTVTEGPSQVSTEDGGQPIMTHTPAAAVRDPPPARCSPAAQVRADILWLADFGRARDSSICALFVCVCDGVCVTLMCVQDAAPSTIDGRGGKGKKRPRAGEGGAGSSASGVTPSTCGCARLPSPLLLVVPAPRPPPLIFFLLLCFTYALPAMNAPLWLLCPAQLHGMV